MNIPYTWNDDHGYIFKYVRNQNSVVDEIEMWIALKIKLSLLLFLVVAGRGLDGDGLCSNVCDHNVVR